MADKRTFAAVVTLGTLILLAVLLIAAMLVYAGHHIRILKTNATATFKKITSTKNVLTELVSPIVETAGAAAGAAIASHRRAKDA